MPIDLDPLAAAINVQDGKLVQTKEATRCSISTFYSFVIHVDIER